MMNTLAGKLCSMHVIAYILVWIGAINWGLVAVGWYTNMNFNLVNLLLGGYPFVEQAVYLVVGLAAVVMLFQGSCEYCTKEIVKEME